MTDYHCIEKLFRIPTEGIHYDDLSSEQQTMEAFDEDGEVPDFISGEAINSSSFISLITSETLSFYAKIPMVKK